MQAAYIAVPEYFGQLFPYQCILCILRGCPTSLDRFAAKLSYNSVIDVMPLASSLQGRAAEDERDYIPHRAFVHRKSNEVVFGCNG